MKRKSFFFILFLVKGIFKTSHICRFYQWGIETFNIPSCNSRPKQCLNVPDSSGFCSQFYIQIKYFNTLWFMNKLKCPPSYHEWASNLVLVIRAKAVLSDKHIRNTRRSGLNLGTLASINPSKKSEILRPCSTHWRQILVYYIWFVFSYVINNDKYCVFPVSLVTHSVNPKYWDNRHYSIS